MGASLLVAPGQPQLSSELGLGMGPYSRVDLDIQTPVFDQTLS